MEELSFRNISSYGNGTTASNHFLVENYFIQFEVNQ